jgi:predicted DNA-binding transcriptional regulator AlpA
VILVRARTRPTMARAEQRGCGSNHGSVRDEDLDFRPAAGWRERNAPAFFLLSHRVISPCDWLSRPLSPSVKAMTLPDPESSAAREPEAAREGRPGADHLISVAYIRALFKLGRTAAYELTRRPGFPAPVQVSSRCLPWWASEVDTYAGALQREGAQRGTGRRPRPRPRSASRGSPRCGSVPPRSRPTTTSPGSAGRSAPGRMASGTSSWPTPPPTAGCAGAS